MEFYIKYVLAFLSAMQWKNTPTILLGWVGIMIDAVVDVQNTFKNGISRERLELSSCSFAWKYTRVRRFENDTFRKIRACGPAQPTYQPKMKKIV